MHVVHNIGHFDLYIDLSILSMSIFEYEYFIQEAHIYTDMYFCYIVYTKYSGSQSHIAVSFNTVRGYETRRI
jgi:hypothetical protein